MTDPRNHVMTDRLRCVWMETGEWALAGSRSGFAGFADWPEVVELAQKILAANEAWLDSQTPTLEELRAKYPEWSMLSIRDGDGRFRGALDIPGCPGGAECRWTTGPWGTERDALRWLAAKLEELDSMPPPDEAALDAQRE